MRIIFVVIFLFNFCFLGYLNAGQSLWFRENQKRIPVSKSNVIANVSNAPPAEQDTWQLRENKENISVYTRPVAGSPILEYKSNAIVDAPLAKVVALFEDEKQIPQWYYQCVHAELVEKKGPNQEIIYLILHLPWPVAPRDFVFSRTRTDPAKGVVRYSLTALPDRLPLVKGMIRVQSIKSLWTFQSLSADKTEIFFQQHTEPGGDIPAFMINKISADTPYHSLKNFRKLVTGKT